MRTCTGCGVILVHRHNAKYCSVKCQQDLKYRLFIEKWKRGIVSGGIGKKVKALSASVRRYVIQLNGEKCSECGWNKRNPKTNKVPIEIDHIDGNADNNTAENLRLLCPNCHSLTPHFRNLNKGHGRAWRLRK